MVVLASNVFLARPIDDLNWVIYLLAGVMLLTVTGKLLFTNNFSAIGNMERFIEINDNQALFSLVFQLMFALLLGALLFPHLTVEYDYIFHTPLIKTLSFTVL